MKLRYLSLQNFRLHADTEITFPQYGIVGILGSNESGKSTILEAITWALFGAKATRGTKEHMRWFRAPARKIASVTLVFEIGGDVYEVVRTETSATVSAMGPTPLTVAEGTSAVNEYLPKVLKMSLDEFTSSFMVRQKDVARIPLMGATDRVAFIRSVMGMGRIDEALDACRKERSRLAAKHEGALSGLGEREPLVLALGDARDARRAAAAFSAKARSAAHTLEAVHTLAMGELTRATEAAARHAVLTADLKKAEGDHLASRAELAALNTRLETIVAAEGELAEGEPLVARLPQLRKDEQALADAAAIVKERRHLQDAVQMRATQAASYKETIDDAQYQIDRHDAEAWVAAREAAKGAKAFLEGLQRARHATHNRLTALAQSDARDVERIADKLTSLNALGADGECPTCTRALGEWLHAALGALEDELRARGKAAADAQAAAAEWEAPSDDEKAAEAALDAAATEVDRLDIIRSDHDLALTVISRWTPVLQLEQERLAEATAKLEALGPEQRYDEDEHAALKAQIGEFGALNLRLVALRTRTEEKADVEERIARQSAQEADANARADKAAADLAALDFDADSHAAATKREADTSQALQDARIAVATAEERARACDAALSVAEGAVAEHDKRAETLKALASELLTHERAAARLAEFRVVAAASLRPAMEELMSGFVQVLTDGRHESVALDDDFRATLFEDGVPVEVVSGGTEDIVALAMRLALSQMIAERAGHPLSLLVLDEPFGSLDDTRRGNVLALITLLKAVFPQVVLISHVAETRDAVDHVFEFEFDQGAGKAVLVAA